MPTQVKAAPADWYRSTEGLGVWKGKGKVAAVGVGFAPTARRWDGKGETSVGANSIFALRKAIEDAGVKPEKIDGLVMAQETSTGAPWGDRPLPEDFVKAYKPTDVRTDGIDRLSAEWILKNVPELTNVKFSMYGPGCMSRCIPVAAEAVARGLTHTCLVLKSWQNFEGRYHVGLAERGVAGDTTSGRGKWAALGGGPACYQTAMQFQRYLDKYGKSHDMMAPFVVNSKRNGLLFPEGFFAQHRAEPLTVEDYLAARWIAKPANLYDNDMPICVSMALLFTTPERARDMKQKPVYILNHASDRSVARSLMYTLEEVEEMSASTGRKLYEGSGTTASDLSFENMYDGFTLFHVFHIEGIGYAGIKRGEALDLFQTDISIEGPHPVLPSGGNCGSGRSRFWMAADSVQQLQGRAGKRQVRKKAELTISGGPFPYGGDFTVWSATPD